MGGAASELAEVECVRCVYSKATVDLWVYYEPREDDTQIPPNLIKQLYERRFYPVDFSDLSEIEYGPREGEVYPRIRVREIENAVKENPNIAPNKIQEIQEMDNDG